ncbi:Uncharacterised protein [Vibrio cholerae]|nr:Uncharacterised protein [Vibrio cholerae]
MGCNASVENPECRAASTAFVGGFSASTCGVRAVCARQSLFERCRSSAVPKRHLFIGASAEIRAGQPLCPSRITDCLPCAASAQPRSGAQSRSHAGVE